MACGDECFSIVLQLAIFGVTGGAVIALNAAGFTLSYAVARQMNLAHGSVFGLCTVIVAHLAGQIGITAGDPAPLRILALVLLSGVGAVCGAGLNVLVELLAFRPFRERGDRLAPLVASVGLSFVLFQALYWWWAVFPPVTATQRQGHFGVNLPLRAMPDLLPVVELGWGGVSFTLKDLVVLVLAIAVALGGSVWLRRARAGRLLRASAQDPELTALLGGDPRRAQTLAFAVAGALAGLGAAIFATYHGGTGAQQGLRTGLTAMTAAVLGGVGDPRGALLGGIALGVFGSFSDFFLDARWTPVLTLLLLVLLLAFRPSGLLGHAEVVAGDERQPAASWGRSQHAPAVLTGLLAIGALYPLLDQAMSWQRVPSATATLLLISLSVGLFLVVGMAGLLDVGYVAFVAIGGYVMALLAGPGSRVAEFVPGMFREAWIALPLAGVVAALFGLVFGLPSVRTRGEYLTIVTLAFGELVPGVIWHLEWAGGARGMSGVPLPALPPPIAVRSPLHAYLLALGLSLLVVAAAFRLARSRIGRAWAAVREDDLAATSAGVPATHMKLLAFTLGAGVAGLAGAIQAGQAGSVEPGQFDFTLSLSVLAAVIIGGRWGVGGAVLGALVVAGYERVLMDGLTSLLRQVGTGLSVPSLANADLRDQNFLVFGLALYLATGPISLSRGPWMQHRRLPLARAPGTA